MTWEAKNNLYLNAALAWLKLKLQHYLHGHQTSELDEATTRFQALENHQSTLRNLMELLGLTRFEQQTLLLCAAPELDQQFTVLYNQAVGGPLPTFSLALSLFEIPEWQALSPERPLRFWRLVEPAGAGPLTLNPLRIDERILNYIKGINYLDDRLSHLVRPMIWANLDSQLPPSQQTLVTRTIHYLEQLKPPDLIPIIHLIGTDAHSKQLVAWHIAQTLGWVIYHLPTTLFPNDIHQLETFIRLWQRESLLLPIALYLDTGDVDENNTTYLLDRFLSRSDGRFFLDTRDIHHSFLRDTIHLEVKKPTTSEQYETWVNLLQDESLSDLLVSQFNLSIPSIHSIATTKDSVWAASLIFTRPQLDTLATRIEPRAIWDDLILPDTTLHILRQIANQIRHRRRIYEAWGFRQRLSRGLGTTALFVGESGTGKTMAAEVIANDLGLNLYRIDLSATVSKYIGETEKNLRRLFDAAEDGGAILLFDEADALFGKRSQVKDSHDRYANIETNYLLQRMEAYEGLAILTTNMKNLLDDAFMRRIRFVVHFPFPATDARKTIWQSIFPPQTPLQSLDYDRLADFELVGGNILNIALNASFLAAQDGQAVGMLHILGAIRTEMLKVDRLIDESLFLWD